MVKSRTARAEARSCFLYYIKQKHKKSKKLVRSTKERLLHLLSKDIQRFMELASRISTDVLGGKYEKHVQTAGYKAGHAVILGDESSHVYGG